MNIIRSMRTACAVAIGLAFALPSLAEEGRGFYSGAGAGFSETADIDWIAAPDTGDPVTAFGGFRFNSRFGVEGFYADFKPDSLVTRNEGNLYTRSFQGAGLAPADTSTVAGFSAIANLPEGGPVKPFARAGLHYYDLEGTGAASGDSLLLGAGADIEISRGWNARLEWEHYSDIISSDRNVFSARFEFSF